MKKIALLTITIVLLLCNNVKASDTSASKVKEIIVSHAINLGVDPALALSIAKSESDFKHKIKSSCLLFKISKHHRHLQHL